MARNKKSAGIKVIQDAEADGVSLCIVAHVTRRMATFAYEYRETQALSPIHVEVPTSQGILDTNTMHELRNQSLKP